MLKAVVVVVMVGSVAMVAMVVTDQTIPVKIESPSTTMSVERLQRMLLLLQQQQQQQSMLCQAHVL